MLAVSLVTARLCSLSLQFRPGRTWKRSNNSGVPLARKTSQPGCWAVCNIAFGATASKSVWLYDFIITFSERQPRPDGVLHSSFKPFQGRGCRGAYASSSLNTFAIRNLCTARGSLPAFAHVNRPSHNHRVLGSQGKDKQPSPPHQYYSALLFSPYVPPTVHNPHRLSRFPVLGRLRAMWDARTDTAMHESSLAVSHGLVNLRNEDS